jgi:hypothetical protein
VTTRITYTTGSGGARVNSDRIGRPSEEEREVLYVKFEYLYSLGYSDLVIAENTGVCDRTVRRWRYKHHLPSIYGKYPTRETT